MGESRNVLLVFDGKLIHDEIKSCLAAQGYSVSTAPGGADALRMAASSPTDLVLIDAGSTDMDGLTICAKIKKEDATKHIPVLMVIHAGEGGGRAEALSAGADDFITRPVESHELVARVKSLLRLKGLHDELGDSRRAMQDRQTMKDNLMHMLVHDFRNPITGIIGYVELMKEGGVGEEDRALFLDKCLFLANRLSMMVSDLLDLGRLEEKRLPLKPEELSVAGLVREVLDEFARALEEKGLMASIVEEGRGARALLDRALMTRVVGNIVSNGVRYSPEGGRLTFTIKESGGLVELTIANEGSHIPPEVLEHIFEKYYQAEAKAANIRSGAGLGLAFCDMVVKAHGGSICAVNNAGPGCSFIIKLPVIPEAPAFGA